MFLLSAPNNFYIVFSSYVEEYVKKKFKSEFHVFGWFTDLQIVEAFWKIYYGASLEIISRQK